MTEKMDEQDFYEAINKLRPLPPHGKALLDQAKAGADEIASAVVLNMLNANAFLEVGNLEGADALAAALTEYLDGVPKLYLHLAINSLGAQLVRQLTKGYASMGDFKAALDAGKIEGYTSKSPEERDRDLLGVPPDQAPPLS